MKAQVVMFLYAIKKHFSRLKNLENLQKIIIEEFIPGREIQAAIIGKKAWCNRIET